MKLLINNGNKVRKYIEIHEIVSDITVVVEYLKECYAIILQTLGSRYKINWNKFKELLMATARIIVATYLE